MPLKLKEVIEIQTNMYDFVSLSTCHTISMRHLQSFQMYQTTGMFAYNHVNMDYLCIFRRAIKTARITDQTSFS